MRWRSVVALICIVAACTFASTPVHAASPLNARDADADVVLVLPALEHRTLNAERYNLHRFVHALHKQHLRVAFVPLSKILGTRSPHSLTAEDVRLYLRS